MLNNKVKMFVLLLMAVGGMVQTASAYNFIETGTSLINSSSVTFQYIFNGSDINGISANITDYQPPSDISSRWVKYSGNPVFSPNATLGQFDSFAVEQPFVYKENGTYNILYEAIPVAGLQYNISHATSSDLITWIRDPLNPIFKPSALGWDSVATGQPNLILYDNGTPRRINGKLVMFYAGYKTTWQIGYATADTINGTWTKYVGNPIVDNGQSWRSVVAATPSNIFWGPTNTYYIYYEAWGSDSNRYEGVTTSQDLTTWADNGRITVLDINGNDISNRVMNADVLVNNGVVYLFWLDGSPRNDNMAIHVATSTDPSTFTFHDNGVAISIGNTINAWDNPSVYVPHIYAPTVRVFNNTWYMFYQGGGSSGGHRTDFGYATSSNLSSAFAGESGLIGDWEFDNNLVDISENGNNGLWKAVAGTANYSYGKIGNGTFFNGTYNTDYVSVLNDTSLNPTSAISVEAWVYPTYVGGGSQSAQLVRKSDTKGYMLQIYQQKFRGGFFNTAGTPFDFNGATTVVPNQWYHVVMTYDSATQRVKLYVNNTLDADNAGTGNIGVATANLLIGYHPSGSQPKYFNGTIDNVRIYNRALSPSEISQHYYSHLQELRANTTSNTTLSSMWNGTGLISIPFNNSETISGIRFQLPNTTTINNTQRLAGISVIRDYTNTTRWNATIYIDVPIFNGINNNIYPNNSITFDTNFTGKQKITKFIVAPTINNVTINVSTWGTSGDYHKIFTASSITHTNPTTFTIGDFPASTRLSIKVDGVQSATPTTNGTGYITFTYTGGYSSHVFDISILALEALDTNWCNPYESSPYGALQFGTILTFVIGAALLFYGFREANFTLMMAGVAVIVGSIIALTIGAAVISRMLICQ